MTKAEAQRLIRLGSTAPAGYHLIGLRRTRAGHTAERFWDWGVDLFTPDGSRVLVRSAQEWRRIAGEPVERPSQPVLDAVIAGEE